MKKTINIIIPYFGEFPGYFQLFLNSCSYNEAVNWTLITDNEEKYDFPSNVSVIKSSFSEIQKLIQSKFDFEVVIESVHKLCEYKPAYAYIFPEYIEGYDFWGYGDIDLIYGNINHFVTDEVLNYNKVFTLGHFTLIKNEIKYNEMFMQPVKGEYLYKKAFSSPENFNFDEQFKDRLNINTIFLEHGCSVWQERYAADIFTKSSDFLLDIGDGSTEEKKNGVFIWNKGELHRYVKRDNKIVTEEYMYIHLQKRKMKTEINSSFNVIKIIPNTFSDLEIPVEEIEAKFEQIKKKKMNLQYFRIRYRNFGVKSKDFIRKIIAR